ncbi:hypothetical protein RDI58_017339 [Solanum bulbocastanum]|uniref:Peptidase A1 domain-containing protein n=1 Tax=Solanum bulbocastanum TaxID=147425 RepID=A0AAN8TB57_SOLBU
MDMRSEASISQLMIDHDLEKDTNEFQIYPLYTSEFLVPLKIGTPPVAQILAMDTGSLYFWVQCDGKRSIGPLYKYSESSSYVEDVFCDTPMCDLIMLKGQCGVSRRCDYTYKYATGVTKGNIASDVVTC